MLTGEGSALTKPGAPTVKQTAGKPCIKLQDAGYSINSCVQLTSQVGQAVAFTELRNADERVLVYTLRGDQATLALREDRTVTSSTGNGGQGTLTDIFMSDLAGDGQEKFVVTTPQGTDQTQFAALDVVEASGVVVLHRALMGGFARKAPVGGGLESFTPAADGKVTDAIIRYTNGQWRLASVSTIGSAQVPSTGGF